MTLATAPARACDVCRSWPCRCLREPLLTVYREPSVAVEACACGRSIVAYERHPAAIALAVRVHNRATTHALWRRWMGI